MKKTRTWRCPCCNISIRRYKNNHDRPKCKRCNIYMVKSIKQTIQRKCRCVRIDEKKRKFKERYYTKVRNIGGEILKISTETNQLWKSIRKVKQKPAFLRRANLWLESLNKDLWNCKDENKMFKIINNNGIIERHKGGMTSTPEIIFKDYNINIKGQYTRHFTKDIHEIFIHIKYPILDMRATLLHEVVHFLDDVVDMGGIGIGLCHDYYFQKRLEWMSKKFKVN